MNPGKRVCLYCLMVYARAAQPTIEYVTVPQFGVCGVHVHFPCPSAPVQHYAGVGCPVYAHELIVAAHLRMMADSYWLYESIAQEEVLSALRCAATRQRLWSHMREPLLYGAVRGGFVRHKYGVKQPGFWTVLLVLIGMSVLPIKLAQAAENLRGLRDRWWPKP